MPHDDGCDHVEQDVIRPADKRVHRVSSAGSGWPKEARAAECAPERPLVARRGRRRQREGVVVPMDAALGSAAASRRQPRERAAPVGLHRLSSQPPLVAAVRAHRRPIWHRGRQRRREARELLRAVHDPPADNGEHGGDVLDGVLGHPERSADSTATSPNIPGTSRPLRSASPEHLIKVAGVAQLRPAPPQLGRELRTELAALVPDALVRDGNAPLRQDHFQVPRAQAEPMIEPDGRANDLSREAVSRVGHRGRRHPARLHWLGCSDHHPSICQCLVATWSALGPIRQGGLVEETRSSASSPEGGSAPKRPARPRYGLDAAGLGRQKHRCTDLPQLAICLGGLTRYPFLSGGLGARPT